MVKEKVKDFMVSMENGISLAQQQIHFGEHSHHSIQIKQKELFFAIWEKIKYVFSAELSFIERLKGIGHIFIDFVSYPLFKLDSEPIAIINIFIGLTLLFVGLKYARILSYKSTAELVKITKMDKTSEESIKKIVHYVFMIIITILVLDVSHVPITVFTVMGGALAIGIGLGTQNISNDFISGIIIMIERPFKIGDIVEVNGSIGRVQQIGSRCTFLKDGENKGVMVPNSELLKNKIINWSYSGEFIKITSIVPVEHESPIVKVTEILEKALLSHHSIIKEINLPRAFLVNFDEKALNFEMVFIINLKSTDKREILHQVHSRILADFAANNIKLASKKRNEDSTKSAEYHLDRSGDALYETAEEDEEDDNSA
jgi:potassium efflux system protein